LKKGLLNFTLPSHDLAPNDTMVALTPGDENDDIGYGSRYLVLFPGSWGFAHLILERDEDLSRGIASNASRGTLTQLW